uniref:Nad6 protein n=1 Tax=Trichinella zimbabwensis TaxID=268475 RepID=A0A0A0V0S0_9BILA|nr:NADH dehydrogenase subunit 6 [Trichinella zimbabwensis]AIW57079.1 NADH dehydrogenase subunit 6 [Trichinella zimbabwensis]
MWILTPATISYPGSRILTVLTHPLWISTLVFLLSIITAIHKFYSIHNNSMFGYLFVMIYSGDVLIMLTYISSLTPSTTTNKLSIKTMITIMITIPAMYLFTWAITKHNLNENYNYNELNRNGASCREMAGLSKVTVFDLLVRRFNTIMLSALTCRTLSSL